MENVLKDAIKFYGTETQLNVAIEELSELIKELCKAKRGIPHQDHIAEEMADVKIILEELMIIFNNKHRVSNWYNAKLRRLSDRMKKEKGYETW